MLLLLIFIFSKLCEQKSWISCSFDKGMYFLHNLEILRNFLCIFITEILYFAYPFVILVSFHLETSLVSFFHCYTLPL